MTEAGVSHYAGLVSMCRRDFCLTLSNMRNRSIWSSLDMMSQSFVWLCRTGNNGHRKDNVSVLQDRPATWGDLCVLLLQEVGCSLASAQGPEWFDESTESVGVRVPDVIDPLVVEVCAAVNVVHVEAKHAAWVCLYIPQISDGGSFGDFESMLRRLRDSVVEWMSRRRNHAGEVVLGMDANMQRPGDIEGICGDKVTRICR